MSGESSQESLNLPKARPYQDELLATAKEKNTLICLGTGAGKTYIAVMLIEHFSHELEPPYDGDGKRTFFLVPTRPLVKQQAAEIVAKSRFGKDDVGEYTGDMNVDFWSKDIWLEHFRHKKVLVMTRQIFLNNLNSGALPLKKVNLLIFDEAHHASPKKRNKPSNDPYGLIMDYIKSTPESEHPRILGLSASLINANSNSNSLQTTIRTLEEIYNSTCTSVTNLDEVRKYAADPVESLQLYEDDETDFKCDEIERLLSSVYAMFYELNRFKATIKERKMAEKAEQAVNNACLVVGLPVDIDDFTDCSCNIQTILRSMGPWCGIEACNFYIQEFRNYIELYEHSYPQFSRILTTVSNMIMTINGLIKYNAFLRHLTLRDMLLTYSSDKMKKLLLLLNEYRDSDKHLAGIVFVEHRVTCKALCKWLQKIRCVDETFEFLKTDYMVGLAAKPGFSNKIAVKAAQAQKETLKKFRQRDLNVLVSTSILEEGLDVAQCNLVVRYDGVSSYRKWIQSQGRARSKDGRFVIFTSRESKKKTELDLCEFKKLYKELQTITTSPQNRLCLLTPKITESVPQDEMPLINAVNGARVTLDTAKQIVLMYCSRLPSDAFFTINPVERLSHTVNGYQLAIRLPINSPVKEEIEGPFKRSESLAAQAAYLKVCRILRELDEIDESFVPYTKKAKLKKIIDEFNLSCSIDDDDCEENDGPGKPGTTKRKQIYRKCYEKLFADSPITSSTPICLYSIDIQPKAGDKSLGFICSQHVQFSNIVSSFPVFIKTAEFTVSVTTVDINFNLNSDELDRVQQFHQVVFDESLGFKRKQFSFDKASPVYFVPLNDQLNVDWDMIEVTLDRNEKNKTHNLSNDDENRKRFVFNPTDYNDVMVYRCYEPIGLFEVLEVNAKTPTSKFPSNDNGYETYTDYYMEKYGLTIIHPTLPLLTVDSIGFNSSIKRIEPTKSEKKRNPIDLVPEFLVIFPIPTSFHRQCRLLPAIFYRLCQVYNIERLRERIAGETNFGWNQVSPDHLWGTLNFDCDKSNCCHDEYVVDGTTAHGKDIDPDTGLNQQPIDDVTSNAMDHKMVHEAEIIPPSSGIYGDINELVRQYSNFNAQIYISSMESELFQLFKELFEAPLFNYDPGNCSQYLPQISDQNRKDTFVDFNRVKSFDCLTVDDDDGIIGPTPSHLLQALTTRNAIDMFNMERMETLGDSFLKLTTSAYLYHKLPALDEGYLTLLKVNQISNRNLYRLGKMKNLPEFIVAHQFQPTNSWLPPGFYVNNDKPENDEQPYDKFTQQKIADKSVADCCEALIGAYLLTGGPNGAVKFMTWLGIRIMDPMMSENGHHWLQSPRSISIESTDAEIKMKNLASTLVGFEKHIGYTFRNKCFLIQAMTHVSYHDNTITDCYQRLEFLGDAVLDYLITRYIFEDPKRFTPGDLTWLRAALTNNSFFGSLAVKHKFHVHLKMNSYDLYRAIHSFVGKSKTNETGVVYGNFTTLLDEREAQTVDEIEVPKALGDVFESIAGAIYLDSNYSLDAVWRVYYPLMKLELDEFRHNIPKSAISLLYIKYPDSVKFGEVTMVKRNKMSVTVTVNHKYGCFTEEGFGKNRMWAKNSAAKRALKRKM